ncbi:MAG: glycogen/starch synthase [Simkaniaceae bacterium]|nr:glycogen/starch synthase [Simkaniaceae bacterium]
MEPTTNLITREPFGPEVQKARFRTLNGKPLPRLDRLATEIFKSTIQNPDHPLVLNEIERFYGPHLLKAEGNLLLHFSENLRPHLQREIERIQSAVFGKPLIDFTPPEGDWNNRDIIATLTELKEALFREDSGRVTTLSGKLPPAIREAISPITIDSLFYSFNSSYVSLIDQIIQSMEPVELSTQLQQFKQMITTRQIIATPIIPSYPLPPDTPSSLQAGIDAADHLIGILQSRNSTGHILDYEGYRTEIDHLNKAMKGSLYPLLVDKIPGAKENAWFFISQYPDLITIDQLKAIKAVLKAKQDICEIWQTLVAFKERPQDLYHLDNAIKHAIIFPLFRLSKSPEAELQHLVWSYLLTQVMTEYRALDTSPCTERPKTSISLERMHVLIVSAECKGIFSKGGLGTYTQEIAESLVTKGYQVTVLLPDLAQSRTATKVDHFVLRHRFNHIDFESDIKREVRGTINYDLIQDTGAYALYDVHGNPYDERQEERFLHFSSTSAAYIEARKRDFNAVILNDWHAGFVPELLANRYSASFFGGELPPTAFVIHNAGLAAQGWFKDAPLLVSAGLSTHAKRSSMGSAIQFADQVITVSPQYAQELLDGAGDSFVPLLRERATRGTFRGILNGVTMTPPTEERRDLYAEKQQAAADLTTILQGFDGGTRWPHIDLRNKEIVLYVGRYDSTQKGTEHLKHAMKAALEKGAVFICMGTDPDETASLHLDELEYLARGQQAIIIRDYKDEDGKLHYQQNGRIGPLARKAATVGAYLSSYEPCGLTQLEGFKEGMTGAYTQVGGFVNSFVPIGARDDATRVRGMPLNHYDIEQGFRDLLDFMIGLSHEQKSTFYREVQRRGFEHFSWDQRIKDYTHLFQEMTTAAGAGAGAGSA